MRKICVLGILLAVFARADVTLGPVFTDHAVFQREKPLPIWGRADPGDKITVTFADQKVSTVAEANGKWVVVLSPLQASSQPATLLVAGKTSLQINDVVIGDVWLCSGQSNMEFTIDRGLNAEQEIAQAQDPLIRQLKIQRASTDQPSDTANGAWVVCSPASAATFTAVGYFFARDLRPRLNVPIGLINSTWGGTQIELWIGQTALANSPLGTAVAESWQRMQRDYVPKKQAFNLALAAWTAEQAEAKAKSLTFTKPRPPEPPGNGPTHAPSSLFNGMIHPLLPVALRGILWYQGESNWYDPSEYSGLFTTLIRSWREDFGQGELPFYWVQLPNYKMTPDGPSPTWAALREAQTKALALPNTAQAVTIDIGDPNDIHPRNKQEVGRRLALIARANLFNAAVDSSGPTFLAAIREGTALRIKYNHAGTGLTAHDKPLQSFQIAGFDRKFYAARARIDGDSVVISSPQVFAPVAARYAWTNAPEANLYNGAGLPAAPFRSDDW